MSKTIFPAVMAKSPTKALIALGIDEGATLEYNPASGMYMISSELEREVDEGYSYFAESVGFSKGTIDAFIESGILEIYESDKAVIQGESEKTSEPKIWDRAELTMRCGRCGAEEKITDAVGGVTLYMPTTSAAETKLVCSVCGNAMSLSYRNGALMTDEEKAEFEKKRQEEIVKQTAQVTDSDPEPQMKAVPSDEPDKPKEQSDEPQKESV